MASPPVCSQLKMSTDSGPDSGRSSVAASIAADASECAAMPIGSSRLRGPDLCSLARQSQSSSSTSSDRETTRSPSCRPAVTSSRSRVARRVLIARRSRPSSRDDVARLLTVHHGHGLDGDDERIESRGRYRSPPWPT